MTGEPESTPPPDDDSLRDALIQMMSIRGGGRFQVITYSGDDGVRVVRLFGSFPEGALPR